MTSPAPHARHVRGRATRFVFTLLFVGGICSCTALLGDFSVGPASSDTDAGADVYSVPDVVAERVDEQPDGAANGLSGVRQVAVGARHTCALTGNDDVFCWGDNADGQLGQPPQGLTRANKPKKVPLPPGIVGIATIAAGAFHTCVMTAASKQLWCWGRNSCGQLGAGDAVSPSPQPRKVTSVNANANDLTWAVVAPGNDHTCAIDEGGALYCWGCSSRSQAGAIGNSPVSSPTNAQPDKANLAALSANTNHTCGAKGSGGGVACWGTESFGELGDGPPSAEASESATGIALPAQFKSIVTGEHHSCALNANGGIFCWGDNSLGQLGFIDGGSSVDAPVPSVTGGPFAELSANGATTCAISSQGRVVGCVGSNSTGQLGRGGAPDPAPHPEPQAVVAPGSPGNPLVAAKIAVGREHVCAIVGVSGPGNVGSLLCWGNGTDGQIGDGRFGGPPRTAPVPVEKPE